MLYRLSVSRYRDRFVLKGGLLLTVLGVRRPTRDADVQALLVAGDEESLLTVVREVASIAVDDGMTFEASRARAMTIREHAAYPGIGIIVPATLGTARLHVRLDVNFGDPAGAMPQNFEEAVEDVRAFVDPVLRDDSDLLLWNPATRAWAREE